MRRIMLLLIAQAFFALPAATPAQAQMDSREGIALQNQILDLRRDLQNLRDRAPQSSLGGRTLQPTVLSGGNSDMTATLLSRVDRLDEAMRSLSGRVDEMQNALRRQSEDLAKQVSDLNFRLESGAPPRNTPAPPQVSPPPTPLGTQPPLPAGTTPTGPVRRTPELAMQEGNAALARRDYPAAEAAAREVLAGRSPRTLDAQFLLAQALAGKKDPAGAAVAYDDSYTRAKTGPHAADSLLGLASALTTLGEKRAACATLDKMRLEFPAPRADLREAAIAMRQRDGCR